MPFNMNQIPGAVATAISIGSLTFFAGKESGRINELFHKANMAEEDRKSTKDVIFDIHGKVCAIQQDIEYIKNDK